MSLEGYFDLQVNGYAGVDFNQDDLAAEALHHACERLAEDGVSAIYATIITEKIPTMTARIARLAALRAADPLAQSLIRGLHLEGPFLNPAEGYRGAHPQDAIQPATVDAAKVLLDAGEGLVRLITLAPEFDEGFRATRYLCDQGVLVSAGHCDPSLEQLRAAIDSGISLFTHLGNGCPMLLHRHDNVIQRALSLADRITLCLIGDGAHVPYFAMGNYLRVAGIDRCIVVTDATAAAGMGPGRYRLGRWEVDVSEDLTAWAPDRSHLVGSAVTMQRAAENLRGILGLAEGEVDRLVRENPKAMMVSV